MFKPLDTQQSLFDLGGQCISCGYCDMYINFALDAGKTIEDAPIEVRIVQPDDDPSLCDVIVLRLSYDQAEQFAERLLRLAASEKLPKSH